MDKDSTSDHTTSGQEIELLNMNLVLPDALNQKLGICLTL